MYGFSAAEVSVVVPGVGDNLRVENVELEARVADLRAQLVAAEGRVASLERALRSSRRIGAAMGILMAVRRVSEDQALHVLREVSQASNRKIRDVAEDVLYAGEIVDLVAIRAVGVADARDSGSRGVTAPGGLTV